MEVKKRPRYAFIPFGFGFRKCSAFKFTYYEVIAALSALLPRFQFEHSDVEKAKNVGKLFNFVTIPSEDLYVKVTKRE